MCAYFNYSLRYFFFSHFNFITYNSIVDVGNKTGEYKNKIGPGDLMKVLTYLLGVENKPTKAEVNLFIWVSLIYKYS